MKNKKKIDEQKLAEFFRETDEKKAETDAASKGQSPPVSPSIPPYVCPRCHKPLSSRKEPCPHCGYHGYVPMSESETKRIRIILFIILLGVAIVVYVLTRSS